MKRFLILLCVCLVSRVQAQTQPNNGFDEDVLVSVQTEAIEFMLPRTLDVVTAGQLTSWALQGLTSIDPGLSAVGRDTDLELLVNGQAVLNVTAQSTDPAGWAQAAAKIVTAGYASSPAMRQAGQEAIIKALLDEMLAHLDPYSRYVPPIEALSDRDRRSGHAGIGVTLAQRGRTVSVRDVIMGSPGAVAGIEPGDVIEWVDGHSALNRGQKSVEALLDGPEGTALRMGWRGRDGSSHGATLTRMMIPPETVFPRRGVGGVLILQITGFSQTTDQHVAEVVRDRLKGPGPIAGIILDLRGNRGGVLRSAVSTASTFLPEGVVFRASGRAPGTTRLWLSGGGELAKGVRLTVLVDGGTASAAEVVAAALADRGRAVVIGSSTFGKGVVQTIDPLPDGGELFLTWSRILAPRYWPIQSLGVMPQICTSLGEELLRGQLAALGEGSNLMEPSLRVSRAARAPLTPDQIVAIRGRCPAADGREADVAIAARLIESPASYMAALLPTMPEEH